MSTLSQVTSNLYLFELKTCSSSLWCAILCCEAVTPSFNIKASLSWCQRPGHSCRSAWRSRCLFVCDHSFLLLWGSASPHPWSQDTRHWFLPTSSSRPCRPGRCRRPTLVWGRWSPPRPRGQAWPPADGAASARLPPPFPPETPWVGRVITKDSRLHKHRQWL